MEDTIIIVNDKFDGKQTIETSSVIRFSTVPTSPENPEILSKTLANLYGGDSDQRMINLGLQLQGKKKLDLYFDFGLRLVKKNKVCNLFIDVFYRGAKEWLLLEKGDLIILIDDNKTKLRPIKHKTIEELRMQNIIYENLAFPISLDKLKAIVQSKQVDVRINAKNYKNDFSTEKFRELFKDFYVSVFEGDKPIINENEVSDYQETSRLESDEDTKQVMPEHLDPKEELRKYKEMLDEGLIEKEDYDYKKKELLGL